jgi:hypothetical protein
VAAVVVVVVGKLFGREGVLTRRALLVCCVSYAPPQEAMLEGDGMGRVPFAVVVDAWELMYLTHPPLVLHLLSSAPFR